MSSYRTPASLAHHVSNQLIDGHLVVLVGVEHASKEMVAVVSSIAQTLHTGGEFPYAASMERPFSEEMDADISVIRRPLGKEVPHPSEHSVGCLVMFLPVLEAGPMHLDSDRLPGCPVRYTDVRKTAEKLRYRPREAGKPCLAIKDVFAHSRPRVFLEPRHLKAALRLSPLPADSDDETVLDDVAVAVYKYMSMSVTPSDREGLATLVASSFGIGDIGEVEYAKPK
ncbi:hypothetical protein KIPB_011669, partial [Kipferlia bialata]|eukprot:g11669.t1